MLVTGARAVDRRAEPRLYNLLENLCISRGITMPRLRIIETDARNAFASGVRKGQYSITVTRGLMDALDDAELEAVLGHELTHIENRDVQLLVISAVFVGIISLVGDLLIRAPRALLWSTSRRQRQRLGRRAARRAAAAQRTVAAAAPSSSSSSPSPSSSSPACSPSRSASPCRASASSSPMPARWSSPRIPTP